MFTTKVNGIFYYAIINFTRTQHEPAEIVNIDFSRPRLAGSGPSTDNTPESDDDSLTDDDVIPVSAAPTYEEKRAFLSSLRSLYPKAAILSNHFPNPSQSSQPSTVKKLPRTVTSYFHPRYRTLNSGVLQQMSVSVFENELKITDSEAQYLAQCTSLQAQSSTWHEHRQGRLTSSRFRAICHTSVEKPARSLIKQVLNPYPSPKVPSLTWGIVHESDARKQYESIIKARHSNFSVQSTGLHVHSAYPYLGASPDGLTHCNCCGEGLLEIKCPYSIRNALPTSAPYLLPSKDNYGYRLSQTHDYFYQVQGQMGITNRLFCDFVCWTTKGLHIERILFNATFFDEMETKLRNFFLVVIFPRVLRGPEEESSHPSEETGIFCYCRKGDTGEMVLCDSPNCKHGWFHFPCVQLSSAPVGAWFCPDCRH